jgi:hypothetical protein
MHNEALWQLRHAVNAAIEITHDGDPSDRTLRDVIQATGLQVYRLNAADVIEIAAFGLQGSDAPLRVLRDYAEDTLRREYRWTDQRIAAANIRISLNRRKLREEMIDSLIAAARNG